MRKVYLLPNFVTSLNILGGFFAVIAATKGEFIHAAWAILFSGFCDLLDGRIARMAKATSSFGTEYDSLSDVVSFGMAPAILIYLWALQPFGRVGWLVASLILVCGALRLARFNVSLDRTPKNYFLGLPIPMTGALISTLVIFQSETGWPEDETKGVIALVLSLSLSMLMVSSIPFPSFKEIHWRSRVNAGYLMVGILGAVFLAIHPELMMFWILFSYVLGGLTWALFRKKVHLVHPKNLSTLDTGSKVKY